MSGEQETIRLRSADQHQEPTDRPSEARRQRLGPIPTGKWGTKLNLNAATTEYVQRSGTQPSGSGAETGDSPKWTSVKPHRPC